MMNYWNNLSTVSGLPNRGWGMMRGGHYAFGGMMGGYPTGAWGNGLFIAEGLLHLVTWILVIALLASLVRFIWKKGGK